MIRTSLPSSLRRRGRRRVRRGSTWANILLLALAVIVVVAVPAAITWTDPRDEASGSQPQLLPEISGQNPPELTASTAAPSDDAADALTLLAGLRDVSGTADAEYDRDAFGQAWYDADRNGCDTRNDILRRDLVDTTLKSDTNGCKVLTGTLVDPYSGETVEFVSGTNTSALVQIDHIIPLSWAWHHGAEFWTLEERREFANSPDNLLATIGSINQSKSDSGPDRWMPPAEAVHCDYTSGYVELLAEWDLGVNAAERAFFESALARC